MAVDFDHLVNKTCERVFGETVRYTAGERSFDIAGTYDAAWSQVKMQSGRGGFMPISTTAPRLAVRLSAFPDGVTPEAGNTLVRGNGEAFEVVDLQPDGFGEVGLNLKQTN